MEVGEDESDFSKAMRALKGGDGSEKKKARVPKVDTFVPGGALYAVSQLRRQSPQPLTPLIWLYMLYMCLSVFHSRLWRTMTAC